MVRCLVCDKIFPSESQLERHKNRKTPCDTIKGKHECKLCKILFGHKSRLDTHNQSKKHIININADNLSQIIKKEDKLSMNELKLKEEIELLKNKNEELENTIKENELPKNEENLNIKEDNDLELKSLFTKITTSKTLNNIDLDLINKSYYQLLTIQNLLFVINYSINDLYIDKFWNNIEDDKWIYLDNELIEWFGYKEISGGKEQLVKIIKREFEIDEDYKIYTNEEFLNSDFHSGFKPEWKFGNVTKHIILKPDCFKLTCMQIGTSKSKDIYKYFLEIEKIFKFYNKYILKYNQIKLEKTILIKNTYIDKSLIQCKEWLYLISNPAKARENIFKFGFTTSKKTRLSSYQTGHIEGDKFFYCELYECYNGRSLEKRIEQLLKNFKIPNESEMYQLNFKAFDMLLKTICSNDTESVNTINAFLANDYDKYLNLDSVEFKFNIEEI